MKMLLQKVAHFKVTQNTESLMCQFWLTGRLSLKIKINRKHAPDFLERVLRHFETLRHFSLNYLYFPVGEEGWKGN